MTGTQVAFFGSIGWTLLLLALLALVRVKLTLGGQKRANTFLPSGADLGGFGERITRAHANCTEHLPFALALLLYAMHSGKTGVTDATGPLFLLFRVAQSSLHLWSTRNRVVLVRFGMFVAQAMLMTIWLVALVFG